MNQLWEEYVFVMLRKEVNKQDSSFQNFTVHPQAKKRFWNHNYLQPDILIENKVTNRKYIIDTKWKRPGYSASIQDLRQVYAYARFWDAENVMLLYPGDAENNRNDVFKTEDVVPYSDEAIQHKGFLRFVKVVEEEKLRDNLANEMLDGFVGE